MINLPITWGIRSALYESFTLHKYNANENTYL